MVEEKESNNGDGIREKASALKTMLAKVGAIIKDNMKVSKEKAISVVEQSNNGNVNEVLIAGIVSSASSILSDDNDDTITTTIEYDADGDDAKNGVKKLKSDSLRDNIPDLNKEEETPKT